MIDNIIVKCNYVSALFNLREHLKTPKTLNQFFLNLFLKF
jgi:hypothetical protein